MTMIEAVADDQEPEFATHRGCRGIGRTLREQRLWPGRPATPRARLKLGQRPSRVRLVVVALLQYWEGYPQDLGNFFLEIDNQLSSTQLFVEPSILARELGVFGLQRVLGDRLRPALPGFESSALRLIACLAPACQVRGVQSLAAQDAANCSSVGSSFDLGEDSLFVAGSEVAPDRPLDDFGVGGGAAVIRLSGSVRAASLAPPSHPPLLA